MSRALVVGLGRSGRAAAALLARRGWEVVGADAAGVSAPDLEELGVDVRPDDGPVAGPLDLVVKSPGVPRSAPAVAAAREAGAEVVGELELGVRLLTNPLVGITGTNGKTTTTELTAHLLRVADLPAVACGNLGLPVTDLVDAVDPEAWLVLECSSFQLEDTLRFHPRAAALLNITPDHLDRHGTMEAYLAAKLRIFANQVPGDLAIAPAGIPIPGGARRRTVDEGARGGADAVAWSQGGLHVDGLGRVCAWEDVALRGRHNRQNAMAAAAVAAAAGADAAQIAAGLASFPGVPHRLERVGVRDGVTWINDSKATNPDAAAAALDAYPAGVHLIAGGRGKGTPFAPVAEAARGAVVRAYLVGETADQLARAMDDAGVERVLCGDLERAVRAAARAARPGETVLLAPACASFDQFTSYEARGEAFRRLARELGAR